MRYNNGINLGRNLSIHVYAIHAEIRMVKKDLGCLRKCDRNLALDELIEINVHALSTSQLSKLSKEDIYKEMLRKYARQIEQGKVRS